jgi:hypothetical protein
MGRLMINTPVLHEDPSRLSNDHQVTHLTSTFR